MNRVILMGRLTRDPDMRYAQNENGTTIARFNLAVDRRFKDKEGNTSADFISCVSFAKTAEFIEKYMHQGSKIIAEGRIQTGNYTNKEGQKVYTTDVVVENVDFAESKNASSSNQNNSDRGNYNQDKPYPDNSDGFMNIPDGVEDEGLPFN